jgi:Ran GTPase-activating protein (RanGAP) involved in mRNA processing and transport
MVSDIEDIIQGIGENDPEIQDYSNCILVGPNNNRYVPALQRALRTNTALVTLHLGLSNVNDELAVSLATTLRTNSTIHDLYLGMNKIGCPGATALALCLSTNSTLKLLVLHDNKIGDIGAVAMATALRTNSSLERIVLGNNNIGDEGGIALAKALQTNSTLREISIGLGRDNSCGIETRKAFVHVFRSSDFPVAVVYCLDFDPDDEQCMVESRQVNERRLVKRVISGDIPEVLFPHAVTHLSEKKQHVSKLFTMLRDRPDLIGK